MSSKSSRTLLIGAAAAAALAMALAGGATVAHAFGSLAVGETVSVAKDGIAMGTSWNWSSADEANQHALENCKKWKDKGAPKAADLCRVIATFHNECYAVSLDPKPGTPGAGWAIAEDKETAEARAIAHCKLTAGPDRAQYCEMSESNCDQK
jgi:hypothetical protein